MAEKNSISQEIQLTRTIHVPASSVYTAFISAAGWCEWCCETAEIDAHIGGKLHIYTDGYNAYGNFMILEKDKAIAFTWDGDKEPPTQIYMEIEEQDNNSLITFKVVILDPDGGRDDFAEFLERVWGRALDNLKTVLEKKPE